MAANGKGNGQKKGSASDKPAGKEHNGKAKEAAAAAPDEAEKAAESAESEGAESEGAESEGAESEGAESEGAESEARAREGEAEEKGDEAPAEAEAAPAEKEDAKKAHQAEAPEAPRGAAWGHPIARFEQRWTWLESRLLTFVLVWQILALVAWVFLNGLSESVVTTAGAVFRGVLFAVAFGLGVWRFTKKQDEERRRNLTLLAIAAAIGLTLLWKRSAGAGPGGALSLDRSVVGYFDNIKGWLQEGSTLTLLGGLRGLGTRLTLWLALLGGSLATAAGKHIHVDVVFRFIPKKLRLPVSILNYCFAATVCFAGVWGFFDHIAIESYGSKADDRPAVKIDNALHHIGHHAFFTRKQMGLDLRSLPHVLSGERYDQWMTAATWNAWVDGAGYESRWPAEKVKNLKVPDGTHPPFVVSPDGETTRAALAHTLGLVFPFGLLAIGLRFLLRALLTLSGHYAADPDEAHKEDLRGAGDAGEPGDKAAEGGV